MDLFRQHILRNPEYNIGRALNNVILSQIKMERDGDIIDHGPIRSCVHMLESLYETLEELEDQKVYLTSFEGTFPTRMKVSVKLTHQRRISGGQRGVLRKRSAKITARMRCSNVPTKN